MTFKVFNNYDEGAGFVVAVIAIPVCLAATFLRFLVATRPGSKIGLEDWFALLALLPFLVYASIELWILTTMNGKNVFQVDALPIATVVEIYKVGYVMNIQTPLNQTFAKISLLALYYRIFHIDRIFARLVWGIGGIQVVWCIVMVLIRLLQCKPIAGTYDPTIPSTCLNSQIILAAGDSINSAIDFVMVAMAVWIVRKLQMSQSTKLKLSVLFTLGGFSGIIGIIKIAEAYGKVGSNVEDATWNVVQQATSILCCCAPRYKSLLRKPIFFGKFFSGLFYSSGSRRARYTDETLGVVPTENSNEKSRRKWLSLKESSQSRLAGSESDSLAKEALPNV